MDLRAITVPIDETFALDGDLARPHGALGVVLFAHGMANSRFHPVHRRVAAVLQQARLATLLFDLLTRHEEIEEAFSGRPYVDVGQLTWRLGRALEWLHGDRTTRRLPVGLFGSKSGAAAALRLAARRPESIDAIVSRAGKTSLARAALDQVCAPTLLIASGADPTTTSSNRAALALLRCEGSLQIVPNVTPALDEPAAVERVGVLARDWFLRHLVHARATPSV